MEELIGGILLGSLAASLFPKTAQTVRTVLRPALKLVFKVTYRAASGAAAALETIQGAPAFFDSEVRLITVNRPTSLTEQVLAFRRRKGQPHLLDLNRLLEEVYPRLDELLDEGIALDILAAHEPACIHAEPGEMTEILVNLVSNARDAMPGGGDLTLQVAHVQLDGDGGHRPAGIPPGAYVLLTVRDTGSGMDARTMDQIFEPYFTTRGPGRKKGLGLSAVYGIVRQNHGYIAVSSARKRGATFWVYLPAARDQHSEVAN